MLAIGQSKHVDKVIGETSDKIYSYGTFDAYQQQCIAFAVYCKNQHKAKNLADCRQYVNEYLQYNIGKIYSAYTIKLQASALAKLFHCSTKEFIPTPPRVRKNIKRSRYPKVSAKVSNLFTLHDVRRSNAPHSRSWTNC